MQATDAIKIEYFNLWYEMFKTSGGRLKGNPTKSKDKVWVNYCFDNAGDYRDFQNSFYSLTNPIVEKTRKQSFLKRVKKIFTQ